jgi:sporulation protein YlmC with PRC-barrel domain
LIKTARNTQGLWIFGTVTGGPGYSHNIYTWQNNDLRKKMFEIPHEPSPRPRFSGDLGVLDDHIVVVANDGRHTAKIVDMEAMPASGRQINSLHGKAALYSDSSGMRAAYVDANSKNVKILQFNSIDELGEGKESTIALGAKELGMLEDTVLDIMMTKNTAVIVGKHGYVSIHKNNGGYSLGRCISPFSLHQAIYEP